MEFHHFNLAIKLIIQLIFSLKHINHALLKGKEKIFESESRSVLVGLGPSPSLFMIDGDFGSDFSERRGEKGKGNE